MCNLPPCRRERSRQCISGNPDNFTVSISFEYELERLVAVSMIKGFPSVAKASTDRLYIF